jgi:signal peptidase
MIQKAGIVVFLLLVVAIAAPAASPVGISYVSSDSMSPTLDTNDGYVQVPAGIVERGDIITFYSEERESYVTHRAMQVTPDGIVTKGDGNPSTDQAAGYPLVQQSDVSGKLLTVGDSPVVIPQLGTALGTITDYWYLIVAALGAYLLTAGLRSDRRRSRENLLRSRQVVLPITILVIVAGVAFVSLGGFQQTQVYTVTDEPTNSSATLTVGEPRTETLTLELTASPLAHVVTETDGMEVVSITPTEASTGAVTSPSNRLPQELFDTSEQTVDIRIPPQQTAGPHPTSIRITTYPAVLPGGIINALHGVHPFVAAVTTVLLSIAPLYLLYWLLIDPTTPLRGTRRRPMRKLGDR